MLLELFRILHRLELLKKIALLSHNVMLPRTPRGGEPSIDSSLGIPFQPYSHGVHICFAPLIRMLWAEQREHIGAPETGSTPANQTFMSFSTTAMRLCHL